MKRLKTLSLAMYDFNDSLQTINVNILNMYFGKMVGLTLLNFLLTDATNCNSKLLEQPVHIFSRIQIFTEWFSSQNDSTAKSHI